MQRDLIIYPDERIKMLGADVRVFDDELAALLDDLRDTLEANGMEGISATQIGFPYAVLLVKDEKGELIELVNPRIIHSDGWRESEESTHYLPDVSETLQRYDTIKVVYQDRNGNQTSLEADGAFSALLQRKIDFTFGGSILDKLDAKGRKRIEKQMNAPMPGASCPTVFYRDYLTRGIKWLFVTQLAMLIAGFFVENAAGLRPWFFYATAALLVLTAVYFVYAQYETRRYKSCTSCQTGHIVGNTAFYLVGILILSLAGYFRLG